MTRIWMREQGSVRHLARRHAVLSCAALLCVGGCGARVPSFDAIPKFDSHVHLRTSDPAFVEQAIQDRFALLTICTAAPDTGPIDEQTGYATALVTRFPGQVFWATTFSMESFGSPTWQADVIRQLGQDLDRGAVAVKVWKDIGMTVRQKDGTFVQIDDPRLDPVLDFVASRGKTLVAHIGEPKNCWMPLDKMDVKSNRSYYERHPEYHMYLHPDYPSHEQLIAARDRMLAKHPTLRVVGAHQGSLEWDVDELAKRLDRYPNFAVDLSARVAHLQIQDREKVRRFIRKHSGRLLYGTDTGVDAKADSPAMRKRIHDQWLADWRYFATDEAMTSTRIDGTFRGLKLDEETLKRLYFENARTWLPGVASAAGR